jgi:hypothetical protein
LGTAAEGGGYGGGRRWVRRQKVVATAAEGGVYGGGRRWVRRRKTVGTAAEKGATITAAEAADGTGCNVTV